MFEPIPTSAAAERLRAAIEARTSAEIEEAKAIADLAAEQLATYERHIEEPRGLAIGSTPDQVEQFPTEARDDRFVRKLPTDDPAVAHLSARVDTADAIFFDAMVDRIADILGQQGDGDSKEIRRARSIGILATPARARLMLEEAAEPTSTESDPSGSGSVWPGRLIAGSDRPESLH